MTKYQELICTLYDGEDNNYQAEAKQVKIIYHKNSKNLEEYIKNAAEEGKIIYIEIDATAINKEDLYRLQNLCQFDNWILQFPLKIVSTNNDNTIDKNKLNAVTSCCNKYMFLDMASDWEVLNYFLSLNPCEVYITNSLCFDLPNVKKVCGDVGIRIIANVAQSAWTDSSAITKFFVRPEDVVYYEPFLSGIDFFGENIIQEIMYKAYVRGYWLGNIEEFIIGFNDNVDNRRLPPDFGEKRIGCKKRCMSGSGCKLCIRMKEFGQRLEKTDMIIKPLAKRKD